MPIIRTSPRASVPDEESRSIPATQQLVSTVDPNIKMWVIESHAGGLRITSVLNRNYPKLEALEGYTEHIVDQPPHARVRKVVEGLRPSCVPWSRLVVTELQFIRAASTDAT